MKNYRLPWIVALLLGLLVQAAFVAESEAACARVSLQILQQLTIERVAFDAKLSISNGIPDQPLQNIRVDVSITDSNGTARNDIFYVRPPVLTNVSGTLDGNGSIGAASNGEAHWLIIPSPGAGGQSSAGVEYRVGATLTYTIGAVQETVPIEPAKITVKPMPLLVLDYFMPFQVIGDNPFTAQVEPPVPYPLALRVMNDGYGTASNLRIDSAQPKITENKLGLLIDFKLLGASLNDSAVNPSLSINFGNLASKKASTAAWQMISTLTGRFVEFKTTFTHASDLGGDLTSLIKTTTPHYLTHMVKVNLPGRDERLDFLGYDTDITNNPDKLPQYILESEIPNGSLILADSHSPVATLLPLALPARPTPEAPNVPLNLPNGANGWIYTRMDDPSQGLLKLLDVVRADGVHLDPHNFWIDEGVDRDFRKIWTLQLVDYLSDANIAGSYTLMYAKPDIDTTPPVSSLIFDGPAVGTTPAVITPQTRIIVTSSDNAGGSGVAAMFYKVIGQDQQFVPAYPFNLDLPGSYTVEYYSSDLAGNVETVRSAAITVVAAPPVISVFSATPTVFAPQAPKVVAANRTVDFTLTAQSPAPALSAEVTIRSSSAATIILRTLKNSLTAGSTIHLVWDGRDSAGTLVPTGNYLARAAVSDGLDNLQDLNAPRHTVTSDLTVTSADWFPAAAVEPNPTAAQMHPRIWGTSVVWQDLRNGSWDIYLEDIAGGTAQPATRITTAAGEHQWPALDGASVVWQDSRNGGWDIYGYNRSVQQEFAVATGPGSKERPVVSGDWVAWQDNRNGNWDIYAYNITTQETLRVTSHERDQIHPALSGTTLVWEDYRHGLGSIYSYDLTSRTETRLTTDAANHSDPVISAGRIIWTADSGGQKDLYTYDPQRGAVRVTYGSGDHIQGALYNDLLVYTDFEAGSADPNLSFRLLSSGTGGRLVSLTSRQEEPAVAATVVVWQDNRDGIPQIYSAPFEAAILPITLEVKPGLNLAAIGTSLAATYPTAAALLAAKGSELGIERITALDPQHNSYSVAEAAGGDFVLAQGMGIGLYAGKSGTLRLADYGEKSTYTLYPGMNQIGILSLPFGYSAYDLIQSLGTGNVRSVRRFDSTIGLWQGVAIRSVNGMIEIAGINFVIQPGEAIQVVVASRVDGWSP